MRQLILMRHAEAAHTGIGQSDYDRPLTDRGVQGALAQARLLSEHKILPDKVLCSAALRTKTTWEVMKSHLGDSLCLDFENVFDRSYYETNAAGILSAIRHAGDHIDNLMVVGHNPTIFEAALALAEPMEGQPASPIALRLQNGYPPAALTVFEVSARNWFEVNNTNATLRQFWTPRTA